MTRLYHIAEPGGKDGGDLSPSKEKKISTLHFPSNLKTLNFCLTLPWLPVTRISFIDRTSCFHGITKGELMVHSPFFMAWQLEVNVTIVFIDSRHVHCVYMYCEQSRLAYLKCCLSHTIDMYVNAKPNTQQNARYTANILRYTLPRACLTCFKDA